MIRLKNFALVNQQEVTNPKILIQFSESELMSNELMGFAEGNNRMAKLEKEVFYVKEKAYSFLKTRYHVLIPDGVEKNDQAIRQQLDRADEQNIPFKLQNEVLHHAEHHTNASFSEMKLHEILLSNYLLDNNSDIQQEVTKSKKHQINMKFECLK
ncbi:LPD25 domain-containing protein [Lysinibacillus fusiformis]|uniref:LPD25 domain-containing protein n=1 Tax=Lysinibacillus fusiformis TaxID=28031 RepID=UPI00215B6400|nr:LPD25 domain-containing protein [Lysinibacillus fusiformis]MCR8854907.1 hypothetical protein [Lysinibacillus fusiformis]